MVKKYHHVYKYLKSWCYILPFSEKIFESKNGNAFYESAQVQAIFHELW
jgi:hypothetical protein